MNLQPIVDVLTKTGIDRIELSIDRASQALAVDLRANGLRHFRRLSLADIADGADHSEVIVQMARDLMERVDAMEKARA
jgi:tRNA A37 threonylcarbamoyladenosine modification protein TsaB